MTNNKNFVAVQNVSFVADIEQLVEPAKFPVTLLNPVDPDEKKVVNSLLQWKKAIKDGYEPMPAEIEKKEASARGTARPPRPARKEITKDEADTMSAKSLENRLGIPSDLAETLKEEGLPATIVGEVVKHVEQWSRNIADFYPSTQVEFEHNGTPYKFCVLYVRTDKGQPVELTFNEDKEGVSRSGVVVTAKA
ncbi:hypothetical protein [Mesotoga prima]|uniref:hypothetical protein n=1 Tax=Mesotoga prima TaxID=1184387 RepID=UPI002FDB71F8